jgi:hypothetical protein
MNGRAGKDAGAITMYDGLEAAQEFVEFVGGVKVGFQFAGVQAFADVVETPGQEVQRAGKHFAIG